ncbi:MAG: hypothetical protein ACYCYM_09535 [Saccharofermentanales bacterium]
MMMSKMALLNGSLSLTIEKAARVQTKTERPTVQAVINILLKKYLVNGTVELPSIPKSSLKFPKVGFLTNILGGKAYNSYSGLNAEFTR